MANTDSIVTVAVALGKGIGQSEVFFEEFSTDDFGILLPTTVLQSNEVKAALTACKLAAKKIGDAADELEAIGDDKSEMIRIIVDLGVGLKDFIVGIGQLVDALEQKIQHAADVSAEAKALFLTLSAQLSKMMLDMLLMDAIERYLPFTLFFLRVLGLADWRYMEPGNDAEDTNGYVKKRLHLERIKDLINDPEQHFKDTLGWGKSDFDPYDIFKLYNEFFTEESGYKLRRIGGDAALSKGDFEIKRYSAVSPPGLQVSQKFNFSKNVGHRQKISESFGVNLSADFDLKSKVGLNILPPFKVEVLPVEGEVKGLGKLFFDLNAENKPYYVIGKSIDMLSLTVDNVIVGAGVEAKWDTASKKATVDPILFAEIKKATLRLGSENADSFIGKILADAEIEGSFDLGLEWKLSTGLTIKGSGGLEIALPIHKSIGPLEIGTVYISLAIKEDGKFAFETSASLKGTLGPIEVSIERLGVLTKLGFNDDSTDTKYGLFDSSIAFKPPSGAGIAINAGVVIGGGYLYFDPDKEEYAGALEITIANMVSVKAIGLVTTKMPDGKKGFSMLIILTAEFNPAFQLGFGFTLNGVGGLLGLNRTVLLDPLRDGVRTGAVNNIMFPTNVIANAPRIISDLKAIFPPYEGRFLIGPMAKLGWGTPTLISLSFGLIIEIPGNIAILGVLKIVLPDERASIIKLQVAFVGTIDFDKKMLTFDASLYDSSVLTMSLEGDMALRIKWGDNPNFLVSIGGFHPSYTPPPLGLPQLKRLAITILNNSIAKIRVECYQAVTSNSVQFGAKAELKLDLKACDISGHIAFDALFQFNPFYFIISLSASFKLRAVGIDLMTVHVRMSLEGPTPWRAHGTGSVSLLFIKISANFDITWGDKKTTTLPEIQVLPLLLEQLQKDEQWQIAASGNKNLLVTIRNTESANEALLVLHPSGSLIVQQKLMPLNVDILKIGSQQSADLKIARITEAKSGDTLLQIKEVREDFARAQFQKLSDADKLSKPAFEKMQGGVEISMGSNAMKVGRNIRRKIAYETTIIDKEPVRFRYFELKYQKTTSVFFKQFVQGASVARSVMSSQSKANLQPFEKEKIKVEAEKFVVTQVQDNKPISQQAVFESQIEAQTYMDAQVKQSPGLKNKVQVVSHTEAQLTL